MIVIMMMDVNTSKHIVETERQLRSELLFMLSEQNFLYMINYNDLQESILSAILIILVIHPIFAAAPGLFC